MILRIVFSLTSFTPSGLSMLDTKAGSALKSKKNETKLTKKIYSVRLVWVYLRRWWFLFRPYFKKHNIGIMVLSGDVLFFLSFLSCAARRPLWGLRWWWQHSQGLEGFSTGESKAVWVKGKRPITHISWKKRMKEKPLHRQKERNVKT